MEFEILIASSWLARACGMLLGRGERLKPGQLMALLSCKSVHTMFMKYPIDVAFVDELGIVSKVCTAMPRGRIVYCKGAVCAFERRSVDEDWFKPGDKVLIAARKTTECQEMLCTAG
ncbi:MAG: DUF192 domain-containing protein [Coriobacteriales bacterium]|nr:DUF192 domain-containing protein [Coriobacteriales bacterium]